MMLKHLRVRSECIVTMGMSKLLKCNCAIVCFESFQDGRPLWTAGVALFVKLPFESPCPKNFHYHPQLSRNLYSIRGTRCRDGAIDLRGVI